MTPEEREQMDRLCKTIKDEKDRARFIRLVTENQRSVGAPGKPARAELGGTEVPRPLIEPRQIHPPTAPNQAVTINYRPRRVVR